MNKKGFTLVEIMIITGIICLILAMSLPLFARMRQTAMESRTQAELKSLYKAMTMFQGYTGKFPNRLSELNSYITIRNIEDKYELNPDLP